MVEFITDPRIAYERGRQKQYGKLSRTSYKPPPNPYGYTPVGHLQQLADALSARWSGQSAAELEGKEREARGLFSRIITGARRGRPGAEQYQPFSRPSGSPLPPLQRVMRDDGKEMVAGDAGFPTEDQFKAAGVIPGTFDLEEAKILGRERSEKNRIRYATDMLARARSAGNLGHVDYWVGQINSIRAAERDIADRLSRAATAESQIGAAKLDMNWVIRKSDGKEVSISDYELSQNPDKFNDIPEVVNQGPIQSWVGKQYTDLNEKFALAQNIIDANAQALEIVTETDLDTGAFAPIVTKIKGYLEALGVPVEQLTPALILQTIGNKKALLIRNPKSGLGLTGNTSDADRDFLVDSVIGLAKTNHANEALLIVDTAAQRKKQAELDLQMKWISKHPYQGLIGYRSSEAAKELKKQPLFTKAERARLDVLIETKKNLPFLKQGTLKTVPYVAKQLRSKTSPQ